jgi:hypothetical protein
MTNHISFQRRWGYPRTFGRFAIGPAAPLELTHELEEREQRQEHEYGRSGPAHANGES